MTSERPTQAPAETDALLEHAAELPLAIIQTDGDGTIQRWAGAAERLLGWSAAEVLGKHIEALELIHEADLPLVNAVVGRLRSGPETRMVHRNRTLTRTGGVRHCEWTRIRLAEPGGELPAMLSYVADVTPQVTAEAVAGRAMAELDRWLHACPDGFFALDREWRITHWNPFAERMLERSRSEVLGRKLWSVLPELWGSTFHRAFTEALGDGHLHILEERWPVGQNWYGVTVARSPRGLFVFFRDVTGRRQLEEDLLTAYGEIRLTG